MAIWYIPEVTLLFMADAWNALPGGTSIVEVWTETPHNGNQGASEIVIQKKQVIIDKLLTCITKLEERVIALEGGLTSTSHVVTSVLQEQPTAKTGELEMYLGRPCIILTGLCKEENENLNKLKDVLDKLRKTGISKEEYLRNI